MQIFHNFITLKEAEAERRVLMKLDDGEVLKMNLKQDHQNNIEMSQCFNFQLSLQNVFMKVKFREEVFLFVCRSDRRRKLGDGERRHLCFLID